MTDSRGYGGIRKPLVGAGFRESIEEDRWWKPFSSPMPSIGKGVEEIRMRDETGAYRVVYTARLAEAVYVLHAFQKKTQATSKRDIDLAALRFKELMKGRT